MSRSSTPIGSDATPSPVRNFTPLMGQWSVHAQHARYSGFAGAKAGLALSDKRLSTGTLMATMTFDAETIENTSGGLVLGYGGDNSRYLVVELAAYEAAFAIAEFLPDRNDWQKLDESGSFRSIRPRHPYSIKIVQLENSITLVVDEVKVLEHDLATPLMGDRVGLFGWGTQNITFENVSIQAPSSLFVAMDFSEVFNTLFHEVIVPTARRAGFNPIRMDELVGPGVVLENMEDEISRAEVVLGEITSHNPNVMWELGFAKALEKPTILLAQKGEELPFDIRNRRVIFYVDAMGGKPALEEELEEYLATILH